MARLFISHSSHNNDTAIQVRDWLAANGWDDVFLDLDPERGIVAGQRWKEALQKAAYRCEVVLALVSAEWLASGWCKSEIDAARLMGKKVIVALAGIDESQVPLDLSDEQFIDLSADPQAYRRLKEGLKRAGLDPTSFPFEAGRRPYPGFAYLEEQDAAVFFGRDAQIVRGLDEIRRLVRTGVTRMFVILGASGSGKSSFLRAGLWPRLRRDDQAWLALPILRPERAAISGKYGLSQALQQVMSEPRFADGIRRRGLPRSRADIQDFIGKNDDGLAKLFAAVRDIARGDLPGENAAPPTILLALDQGEELFNEEGREEAKRFIHILTRTLTADPRTLAILVVRSDSFPLVQGDPGLAALPKDTFTLDMMLQGSYRAVIEGPARLVEPTPLKIDPLLTDALLEDISGQDALPLLAFTLAHLHENYAADNELTLAGYDKIGRVKGVIDKTVAQAFAEGVARGEAPKDEKAQLALARSAFIPHLAQVKAGGQFVRRVATLDQIPAEARPLIDRFADQRLLIKDRRKDGEVVEVAHEALLRQPPFSDWLADDREFLMWRERLSQACAAFAAEQRGLLAGRELEIARSYLQTRAAREIDPADQAFIRDSIAADGKRRAEEAEQAREKEIAEREEQERRVRDAERIAAEQKKAAKAGRRTAYVAFAGLAVALLVAAAAVWQYFAAVQARSEALAQTEVAVQAKDAADQAKKDALTQRDRAVQAEKEATKQTQIANGAKEEAEKNAKQAQVERDKSRVQLLATQARREADDLTSADAHERGAALALASLAKSTGPPEADAIEAARSALSLLPLEVLSHGGSWVNVLAVLADGRLASGGQDGKIKLWPKEGHGEPAILSNGSQVYSLAALSDGRLASGGFDGKIRLWPKDGKGEPVVISQGGGPVWSLVELADGRLASSGDGAIKLWTKDGEGEPVVLSHVGRVVSLAVLADGRLASGDYDGTIRLWPKDGGGAPLVLSQGGRLSSLAALADGRLASGGRDGTIKLWPREGAGEPATLSHGSIGVSTMIVLADGRLASGGFDGKIKLWPKEGTDEPVVISHGSQVKSLAVLADGRLASAGNDGKIRLWPKEGASEPVVLTDASWVRSMAVLADGRLASASSENPIRLWSIETMGAPVILLQGSPVWSLAALPDGRLASGGYDGKIKLWPKEGAGAPMVLTHGSSVSALAALADGRLASGGGDGTIKLWSTDGGSEPAVLRHGVQIVSLAVLSDGRLASGGGDGTIKLWPKDGDGEPVILRHGGPIVSLAALADGRLASAGRDGAIKLWSRDLRRAPQVLLHGGPLRSLAVLADGRLASAGDDGAIKLWPREGMGEPVVLQHGSEVWSLAVLPDGRLASGGLEGKIKLWLVDERKLLAALCLRAGRNFTNDEWSRYMGSNTPWQPSCQAFGLPSNWRTPN